MQEAQETVSYYDYDLAIGVVSNATISLVGCRNDEVPNEMRLLRRSLKRLEQIKLKRRNAALEKRRADTVSYAEEVMRRQEGGFKMRAKAMLLK